MDIEQLALLVKKFIEVSKKTDSKPGISYIVERSLNVYSLRLLIQKELEGTNDYLRLFYIVFFLFEGDSMEVAKYKAFNELYYLVVQEVGDSEYEDFDCDYCGGAGQIGCDYCDGEGEIECEVCDGERYFTDGDEYEECIECDAVGSVHCDNCDGEGEIECQTCEGRGMVESDDEYVSLNNEYWVYYGDEISDEINKAIKESRYGLIDVYDILDKSKGGLYLLKTENESVKLIIYDFESQFGPYYDAQGKYNVYDEKNLKDVDLNKSFGIEKFSTSYVIR